MASRSVTVVLKNATGVDLWIADSSLSGGDWDVNVPDPIYAGTLGAWTTQSNGLFTGTQGSASFNTGFDTSVVLTLNWDNPYAGSNSYNVTTVAPYNAVWQGGSGDNAVIVFTIMS